MTPAAAARAGALVLALSAVPAAAEEPSARPGKYRVGPFRLTPRLQLKDAGVDTNVFQTRHAPTRDAVVVVSPRLDGTMRIGRRLRAAGFGYLDLNHYRRQGEESSRDFYGEGDATLDLGPFAILGGGGGGQFSQRFSIDVDERLPRQEKHAYAGVRWQPSRRVSATVTGRGEVFTFAPGTLRLGGAIKEAMDRNTLTGSLALRYGITNKTTAVATLEEQEDRFFSQPLDVPRRQRRSRRYLGGFELGERAAVSGRLLAGIRDYPGTLADGSPPYRGPVLVADLTLPAGERLRLRGVAERDVRYASSLVAVDRLRYRNAFVSARYEAQALVDLPFRLVGLASAGYEDARYLLPYPYPDAARLADRRDHRYTAGVGVARRFGPSVRIGGHLSWARRVSTLPLFSYEGLRYGLDAEVLP
jgi:hypothetical protein